MYPIYIISFHTYYVLYKAMHSYILYTPIHIYTILYYILYTPIHDVFTVSRRGSSWSSLAWAQICVQGISKFGFI